MRTIKAALFVFAGLFIVVTLMSLLIPARVSVSKAVSMRGDSLRIFSEIANLENWQHWHPVFKTGKENIHFSVTGSDQKSIAEWTTSGKVNQVIVTQRKYPFVRVMLRRAGENDVENLLTLMPVQEQGNMQVQWQSVTKLKWYPWEKFGGIFLEKMTGPGYEAALQSLKEYVESH